MKLFIAVLILFLLSFAALAWNLRRQKRKHHVCTCDSDPSEHARNMRIKVTLSKRK